MSQSKDISGLVSLTAVGLMLVLLRFLPHPSWLQSAFGAVVAIFGCLALLLGLQFLFRSLDNDNQRRWHLSAAAGTLVLLVVACWEIAPPHLVPKLAGLHAILWAMGSLTAVSCTASLLAHFYRNRELDRLANRWSRIRTWVLLGLAPCLLSVVVVTPLGSYEALAGPSPPLIRFNIFGMTVDVRALAAWLESLTWIQQTAFWIWVGLSAAVIFVTLSLLWQISGAYRDMEAPSVKAARETSSRERLSNVGRLIFWAALLQGFPYDGRPLGLQVGLAFLGMLLGVAAMLRLRPLAVDAGLHRAWSLAWTGLFAALAANVLDFRAWESPSPWNQWILAGTFLGVVMLPTFCRLMAEICRRQDLAHVGERWQRARQWALYGVLPPLTIYVVASVSWMWAAPEAWTLIWALIEVQPDFWLSLTWELLLKGVFGLIALWTALRILYAASGTHRFQRFADNAATSAPQPLPSAP